MTHPDQTSPMTVGIENYLCGSDRVIAALKAGPLSGDPAIEEAAIMLDALIPAARAAAIWLRNGNYEARGGLCEMSRLASVLEAALSTSPAD